MKSISFSRKFAFRLILAAIAACLLYGVVYGFRADISIITGILNDVENGMSYTEIELAYAVYKVVTAAMAPVVAIVILKKSNRFVLLGGVISLLAGLFVMSFASTLPLLILGLGVLVGVGCAALSFGIIFGIVSPLLGEKSAVILSTLFTIASLCFSVILSPMMQITNNFLGYPVMMLMLSVVIVCTLPLIFILGSSKNEEAVKKEKESLSLVETAKSLFRRKEVYILILFVFMIGLLGGLQNHFYSGLLALDIPVAGASVMFSALKLVTAAASLILTILVLKVKRIFSVTGLVVLLVGALECVIVFMPTESFEMLSSIVVVTVVFAAVYPLQTLIVRRRYAPVLVGSLMCFLGLFENLGSALNGIIGGICYDVFGDFT
ncbi:MAG TPA: MFS transporter, partial [Methanocorpusculum sp.]|nr:MFS transporter [Methanocorpusculum sp.]